MLRTNPPPIVVLGLLRLTSGAVDLSVNFTRLEGRAISVPNKPALASAGVTGAAIAASAVIVVVRYGFELGEGSSTTTTTRPAACIPDKQKAAIASCATDLPLRSPIQPDLNYSRVQSPGLCCWGFLLGRRWRSHKFLGFSASVPRLIPIGKARPQQVMHKAIAPPDLLNKAKVFSVFHKELVIPGGNARAKEDDT